MRFFSHFKSARSRQPPPPRKAAWGIPHPEYRVRRACVETREAEMRGFFPTHTSVWEYPSPKQFDDPDAFNMDNTIRNTELLVFEMVHCTLSDMQLCPLSPA